MSKNTRFLVLAMLGAMGVAGCTAGAATNAVTKASNTVTTDVGTAEAFYATAKGIAQVAEAAQPSLAPMVNKVIATLDPYAAALQAGTPTLAGIAVSAAGLVDQAVQLEQSTVSVVKAVPATKTGS